MITGDHLISGADVKKWAENRGVEEKVISAVRGNIYDRNGEVIAKDSYTYTIVAYLNKSRYDEVNDKPAYVVDKEATAKKLAPILDMKESTILSYLNKTNLYQTYLGPKGKGLDLATKEKIEKLNLPGIEFESVVSRFYPNGVFASSTIGYATYDEKENRMVGKLGVEATYDDELKGTDGVEKVQVDNNGYVKKVISSKPAVNGDDVYLTIDNNIQRIVESNMDEMLNSNPADFALAVVTDAKTNEVLAVSNRPTFDPNKLNIKDFNNPFVSLQFEPGSTMKTFTYAAAMDSGEYNGSAKYYSGPAAIKENGVVVQTVHNYENYNWGTISYDEGYMRSSNTGIVNLFEHYLKTSTFESYMSKFKFYQKTNIEIAGESSGQKVMNRKQEIYTSGFGQASSITPVQLMQAFSAITNEGKEMKPYITEKIVSSAGEIIKEFKPTQVATPIKASTAKKMLKLMTKVVEDERGTGYKWYRLSDYTVAGKTGTAEYVVNGKYATCETCYYTSFLMTAPASNPKVNIYLVTKHDTYPTYAARSKFIKNVASNTLAYLNVKSDKKSTTTTKEVNIFNLESFINKSVVYAKNKLNTNNIKYVILGNGKIIQNQEPLPYSDISSNQKIFLLTNAKSYQMIDLTGYSKADVLKLTSLLNLKVTIKGEGYVYKQSINVGTTLTDKHSLTVYLK
jgi:penicillin-binding protein 2B